MPFKGKDNEEKDAATCAGVIEFSHGESDDVQVACMLPVGSRK